MYGDDFKIIFTLAKLGFCTIICGVGYVIYKLVTLFI